jgi:hypothetical protein
LGAGLVLGRLSLFSRLIKLTELGDIGYHIGIERRPHLDFHF